MKDWGALPPCKEGGDPVDHVREYVLRQEEGPQLRRVDVIKASFYVEEEGGYLQERSLKGIDFMGECGHRVRGAEAREGSRIGSGGAGRLALPEN